ncbi:MAG: hypothetical protein ACE5GA_08845, partial [Candidatus Zixiibacteriota bacterium]
LLRGRNRTRTRVFRSGRHRMRTNLAKVTVACLAALLASHSAPAETGEAGFIGAWRGLPLGARGAAMGDAYASIAEGGYGHLSNPGGLARLRTRRLTTSYRSMDFDRKLSLASVAFPLKEQATLGLTWVYVDYGDVTVRDASGFSADSEIGQQEHQFGLVFSKRFSKRVSIGLSGSFHLWKLGPISANSVLFDVGAVFYVDEFLYDRETINRGPVKDIQVGLVVKSVGSSFIINTSDYWNTNSSSIVGTTIGAEFPRTLSLGVSGRVLDSALLLASELGIHETLGPRFRFGGEYELDDQLRLRAGLKRGALTAGAGFLFNLGGKPLALDYAFQADRVDERAEHLITFDLAF